MLSERSVECPYCGERFEAVIDPSSGDQDYVEDCPVCCQPIEFILRMGVQGRRARLTLRRQDD